MTIATPTPQTPPVAARRTVLEEQLRLGDDDALVTLRRAWEKALSLLAPEINRPSFESFFRTARPISRNGKVATIGAASELAKIFLEKYADLVTTALESTLGGEVELVFSVAPREQPKARATEVKETRRTTGILSPISQPLNDKYTFSSFIVGPSNRLAHAAAQSVAEKPGKVYNPFFLYGGPGLGKTHLLQAIAHHALAKHPAIRVAYVSGEMFTSHYVTALREHRSEDFRQKYRSIDLWLVDDIQFLAGKERTKEEFFHTFNALHQMNKQIVLSSDRSPRDLAPLEERLKSRFEAGLVADVAPPDLETRMAILQAKSSSEETDVPVGVLECVADLIPTNVRALEGALVTLLAYSSLMKVRLSTKLAREVLARYLIEKNCSELTPDAIQRAVAHAFSIEADLLSGPKRDKEIVLARHVAIYLARELTDCSAAVIGRAFGGRNHASVLHARNRIAELIQDDADLKRTVDEVAQGLRSGRLP